MCFHGRPHLKNGGEKCYGYKKLQDFHAMNIITLLTFLQYKKRLLSVTFFLLFVVGKNASHSLQEIEDNEEGNVFSCKKT